MCPIKEDLPCCHPGFPVCKSPGNSVGLAQDPPTKAVTIRVISVARTLFSPDSAPPRTRKISGPARSVKESRLAASQVRSVVVKVRVLYFRILFY